MKKIIGILLTCVFAIGMMLTLVSCDTLSGTYEGAMFDLKFKGEKVTVITKYGNLVGTYDIDEEDGKKTIEFDFIDDDEASEGDKKILTYIKDIASGKLGFEEKDGEINIGTWPIQLTFEKK